MAKEHIFSLFIIKNLSALGTDLFCGHIPRGEITIGVAGATVEGAFFTASDDNVLSTFGTGHVKRGLHIKSEATSGEVRTCIEFTELALS